MRSLRTEGIIFLHCMLCCACLLLNHTCLILLYVYVLPVALQVGEDGAGHYVKMVHNGIEYGDMQLIGEAYHLMKTALGMSTDEMSAVLNSLSLSLSPSFCSILPSFYLSPPPPPPLSLTLPSFFFPPGLQGVEQGRARLIPDRDHH